MTTRERRPRRRNAPPSTWCALPVPPGVVPVPAPLSSEARGLPDPALRERFAEACRRMATAPDDRPAA